MAATAGWKQGDRKTSVTATAAVQIMIFGKGYGNKAATSVTTRWRSELGLVVASATPMVAAKRQQQLQTELGLQDLALVVAERRKQLEYNINRSEANLA